MHIIKNLLSYYLIYCRNELKIYDKILIKGHILTHISYINTMKAKTEIISKYLDYKSKEYNN